MYVINHILTNKERIELIKKCKPFLKKDENFPASQTHPSLHNEKELEYFYNIFIDKIRTKLEKNFSIFTSWVNEDIGRKEDIFWHKHSGVDYTCIYYMRTLPFFNSGTLFKDKFVRVKQNSFLIFPGDILHGTPSYPFHFFKRYTLVIDIKL